jgi:hypothetical protein
MRGIDHLVIAVRDLDFAGRFYEQLGFKVGGRNRHPWGTANRIVQLQGCFLELVTVEDEGLVPPHAERHFSFGRFVSDYLSRREGLAMLVLESSDADLDARAFGRARIGSFEPFHFERRGTRPDGSETRVAFTLAFARDPAAPGIGFFTCQHHFPENFWSPAFQDHPNKASAVAAVSLVSPEPGRHTPFLAPFTGADPAERGEGDLTFALGRGRIDVMTPDDAAETFGSVEVDPGSASLAAFAVRVPDVARLELILGSADIPFQRIGSRFVVPASAAMGVAIAFEPE